MRQVIRFNHISENLTDKQITELKKFYYNYHRPTKCHKWKYNRQKRLKITTLQVTSLGLAAVGAATAVANPLTAVVTGVGVILGSILSKSDLQSRVTQSKFAYMRYGMREFFTELKQS